MDSWKITFLERTISLECKSKVRYPFVPYLYPRNIHFLALGSSLVRCCPKVETKHNEPKTFKSTKQVVCDITFEKGIFDAEQVWAFCLSNRLHEIQHMTKNILGDTHEKVDFLPHSKYDHVSFQLLSFVEEFPHKTIDELDLVLWYESMFHVAAPWMVIGVI